MLIADAIVEFKRERGTSPVEVAVTATAAIMLVAQDQLPSVCFGVPIRVVSPWRTREGEMPMAVVKGQGDRLLLLVVEDKLQRPNVVAVPAELP